MSRGYQDNYSLLHADAVHNLESRNKKAHTTAMVLKDFFSVDLKTLNVLDVGASTGIIDNYLAKYFNSVTGIDIDRAAITHAQNNYIRENLTFKVSDAMNIEESSNTFDIVICSHVYEHVPNQKLLMDEIYRVLTPGGVCYFSAGNRLNIIEPHYNLPFLSILPHFLSNIYLRILKRGKFYYERHLTYWGLKKLVNRFEVHDYTKLIINMPVKFNADYLLPTGSKKVLLAKYISEYVYWLMPGYIWLLEKKE